MEGRRVSENQDDVMVIECEESLDVSLLEDYRALLQQALEQGQPIVLDANKLERIDGAALQLLHAFVKKADASGIDLRWQSPSEALRKAADLLGLRSALRLD